MSEKKAVIFAIVGRPGEKLILEEIMISQTKAYQKGGVSFSEETDSIAPNGLGLYILDPNHANHKVRVAVMKRKMAKVNNEGEPPRLLGPFSDVTEAHKAQHDNRPRSSQEMAVEEKARADKAEKDNESLRKKIADMQKKLNK